MKERGEAASKAPGTALDEKALDEAAALTFPASDPPAYMGSVLIAGRPTAHEADRSTRRRARSRPPGARRGSTRGG